MKTLFKSKMFIVLSALLMTLCAVIGASVFNPQTQASAETEGEPTLTIESNNVSYADSIYILYAVSNSGFNRDVNQIKMLFWEELNEEYIVGTEKYAVTTENKATVKGKPCLIFYARGLAAKEMTQDIYARACVEIGDEVYYSDVVKFSVLEYVHTMREKGGLTTNQQNLFNNLLNYGASAQYQFNHNVDRIANGDYYSITIINGKLPDGFAHGRYKNKEKIKVKAEKAPHGMKFSHWVDEKGIIVSYDEHIAIELKGNKTYEAVYKDISSVATQLILNAEIPYDSDVNEVELPTAVSFDYNGETVILEVTWNTENFQTEQIGTQTFYATLVDQSAYDKYNIARDGIVMHVKTMPYTFEIDQTTGEYILTGYYGADTEITLPTSYKNTFITTIKSKAFNQAKTLTKVEIPNTYKKIEQSAFYLCDNIVSITVPFVGESATSSNSWFGWIFGATNYSTQYNLLPLALKTISLAEGVTKVPANGFYHCHMVENFNLPSTITTIDSWSFQNCTAWTEFTIPDELTSLGHDVFYNSGLKRVNASSVDKVWSLGCSPFGSGADLYVKGKLVTEVTIPAGTTQLNESLSYCTSIKKVNVPNTITSSMWGFEGCRNLTDINIPDSVTSIDWNAFNGCSSLAEIVLPEGVTSIGSSAFANCSSLTEIVLPEGVTSIGSSAFSGCSSLVNVNIPDGVTIINYGTFYNCRALREIILPDGIISIGNAAFRNCRSLTKITIPAYVYDIGSNAFYECYNLAQLTILSQRLTSIGDNAFTYCDKLWEIYNLSELDFAIGSSNDGYIARYAKVIHTSLAETACVNVDENGFITYSDSDENILFGYAGTETDIALPESIGGKPYSIGYNAFYYVLNELTSVVIPENVISISYYAFRGSSYLQTIYYNATNCADMNDGTNPAFYEAGYYEDLIIIVGANVQRIPGNLFAYSGVKTLVFEENSVCESIGTYAFSDTALRSVVLPDSLVRIDGNAFHGCDNLKTLVFGNKIQTIGSAFGKCYSLTSVVIPSSVTSIANNAFENCYSLVEVINQSSHITVTKGATDNGRVGCYALAVYNSGDTFTGTKISKDNGYIIYTDGNEKILVRYEGSEVDLILPTYLTQIHQGAFYRSSVKSVVIPYGVTSIGDSTFYNCYSLTSVNIPSTVTSIGKYAFSGCSKLTQVIIPDSVESIGDFAFEHNKLTCVVLGAGVSSIGVNAFYNYSGYNKLTTVYYKGSAEDWGNITISSGNNYLINATRYYYSEEEPTVDGNFWHYDENGEIVVWTKE